MSRTQYLAVTVLLFVVLVNAKSEIYLLRGIYGLVKSIRDLLEKDGTGGNLRNLAHKRMAFQSSEYSPSPGPPGRAVDGVSDADYGHGSCTSTSRENHPYWYVDLGGLYKINHVTLRNRGDCCGERLHDVKVTVAGEDNRFDVSCGYFTGPGTAGQLVSFSCPVGTKGRYVKVQIVKGQNNILTICEAEVLGWR